jgi:hypothetical protein
LVTSTNNGIIGTSSYCTTDIQTNPLCQQDNNEYCPPSCDDAPYYENKLFKIKIFSDKGYIDIDYTISFSLGVTSTLSKYRDTIISPIDFTIFKNTDESESVNGLAIADSYQNEVFIIDTNSFDNILNLIK